MKMLTILALALLSFASFAESSFPKALVEIESKVALQKEDLKNVEAHLDIVDLVEGKIVASIINSIEEKFETVELELSKINSDEQLTVENIEKIQNILKDIDALIKSI